MSLSSVFLKKRVCLYRYSCVCCCYCVNIYWGCRYRVNKLCERGRTIYHSVVVEKWDVRNLIAYRFLSDDDLVSSLLDFDDDDDDDVLVGEGDIFALNDIRCVIFQFCCFSVFQIAPR